MGDTAGRERAAVAAACRALAPRVSLGTADAVGAVGAMVADTPTLVVAGPVSSGKSTLVNALVGRRVAPTGAGECTRLVAHYRRGPADRLDVVLSDGTRRPLPLASGGRVPAAVGDRLGVDPDDVDHLVVTLTSAALDGLTVIDTPGTGSARRSRSPGVPGVPDAAAALVVLPAAARVRDLDAVGPVVADGPAGVVSVLGRADTVGGARGEGPGLLGDGPGLLGDGPGLLGDGPGDDGRAVAAALGPRLDGRAGPVLPVIGLLAETAVTGALRAEDVTALRRLAALDAATLADALADAELFTTGDLPVPAGARAQLLELLDVRGIGLAVALLRTQPDAGVGEVCEALLAASGLDRLVERLADEVRARTDVLATAAAIRRLDTLAAPLLLPARDPATTPRQPTPGQPTTPEPTTQQPTTRQPAGSQPAGSQPLGDGPQLRDTAATLRRRAGLAEHELLAVRGRLRAGSPPLPDELVTEVDRLTRDGAADQRLGHVGADRVELAGHAARRAAWWRSYAAWGTPRPVADAAHTVHRAYVRLWRELTR